MQPTQLRGIIRGAIAATILTTLASCGGGGGGGSSVTVDHPPTANNTIVRNDSPGATSNAINVLANASDPDKDSLTVSITTPASVGTATVNSDGTVRIAGLPGDFKGLTRFGYTVTDPSGKTASATAAVFIGVDPFRITFACHVSSAPE